MKKLKFLSFFISTTISALCFSQTIHLVADEWCPYNCEPESGKVGFMVETARIIFKRKGYKLKYTTLPWPRAITETRRGNYDGVIGALYTDAPDFVFPENKQGSSRNCFYALNSSEWTYSDPESLKSIDLGVINSYSYGPALDKYIQNNLKKNVFQISGKDDLIKRLIKLMHLGRIDAFVEAETVMDYYLHEHFILKNNIRKVGCFSDPVGLYIAFSPKNDKSEQYARMLSEGIDHLRKSGQLAIIMKRYGLKNK